MTSDVETDEEMESSIFTFLLLKQCLELGSLTSREIYFVDLWLKVQDWCLPFFSVVVVNTWTRAA